MTTIVSLARRRAARMMARQRRLQPDVEAEIERRLAAFVFAELQDPDRDRAADEPTPAERVVPER